MNDQRSPSLARTTALIIGLGALLLAAATTFTLWRMKSRAVVAYGDTARVTERFVRARLEGDCNLAWDMLTDQQRLMTDQEHYCAHMRSKCSDVRIQLDSASETGPRAQVTGSLQCGDAVNVDFTVTLEKVAGRWQIAEFSEGFRE